MKRFLFICTQNSARSLMAEGLANHYLKGQVEAQSAGIAPAGVNPFATQVMAEIRIGISGRRSKYLAELAGQEFDYVISLCSGAQQCPFYFGPGHRLHREFPDLAAQEGSEAGNIAIFRQVRDAQHQELIPELEQLSSSAEEPQSGL